MFLGWAPGPLFAGIPFSIPLGRLIPSEMFSLLCHVSIYYSHLDTPPPSQTHTFPIAIRTVKFGKFTSEFHLNKIRELDKILICVRLFVKH